MLCPHVAVNRGHMHLTGAKVWHNLMVVCHASRQVPCPRIFILQSVAYSPLQVDITDTQLTMQVSFTRFLCCACHDRGEVSAFFGTRRAAELHISRNAGCKTACKGIKSVPVLYRDSQRQEDHEAGPVGAPGHWPARPVPTASSKGASSCPTCA